MSESDDENVFESADEGEESKASQKAGKKKMSAQEKQTPTTQSATVKTPDKESPKKESTKSKKQSPSKKGSSPKKSPRDTHANKQSKSSEKTTTSPEKASAEKETAKDSKDKAVSGRLSEGAENLSEQKQGDTSQTISVQPETAKTKSDFHEDTDGNGESTGTGSGSGSGGGGAFGWGSVLNKLTDAAEKTQKSSWGSWGSSFLSAATNSVQTFTSQVGEGLNTVLESVEDSLGAIDPVEIARMESEKAFQKDIKYEDEAQSAASGESGDATAEQKMSREGGDIKQPPPEGATDAEKSGAEGWMSAWNGIVSDFQGATKTIVSEGLDMSKGLVTGTVDAGKNLLHEGLDVLETIGKTTFDVIAEGDNGLKQTMKKNKVNLSQVLREAKEDSEKRTQEADDDAEEEVNYSVYFDQYQGLVHVEALEMLSNQSETKIHMLMSSLPADGVKVAKQQNNSIKEAFDIDFDSADEDEEDETKDHDFEELVKKYVNGLNIGISSEKLIQVHTKNRDFLGTFEQDEEKNDIKEIHQQAIRSLAELTAKSTETFHKTAELALSRKYEQTYDVMAISLASLTKVLCLELGILSTRYTKCFTKAAAQSEDSSSVSGFITNVYLEASNSSTYIQDCFALLLPVIQQASVESSIQK